ncbi:MarR family winged helix-turn-helix transcriptional regulator [Bifidobacterium apri]|uniref:Transcriptional regulator, MarR family n=1 Tax=Bifidobacterium apri TaxID=1769423 RepID=A0A6A2V780_9BIFI|nr:MarR family winged helix-turn-helix transcriptional regulator [Bifidobacterium apri]KAB8296580.1 Transcriptional regulator, MarR family [Bifidobacterium apri]
MAYDINQPDVAPAVCRDDGKPGPGCSPAPDRITLGVEIQRLGRAVRRYLGLTMPASAREATDGNASIIMFLDRHRGDEIFQHDIETRFCITRSTASRVLTRMEHKGLIIRKPVARDARLKRIVLTQKADRIVADLAANGNRAETSLTVGFTPDELARLRDYLARMHHNMDTALDTAARSQATRAPARSTDHPEPSPAVSQLAASIIHYDRNTIKEGKERNQ